MAFWDNNPLIQAVKQTGSQFLSAVKTVGSAAKQTFEQAKNPLIGAAKEIYNQGTSLMQNNPLVSTPLIGPRVPFNPPRATIKPQEQLGAKVTRTVLNPGSELATPWLNKRGTNPLISAAIGLGLDVAAPGPGEFSKAGKVGDILSEARKYKTAEEFVGFKNTTGLSRYDDMMDTTRKAANGKTLKEYYATQKGMTGDIVPMTPDEYIAASAKGFGQSVDKVVATRGTKYPAEYAAKMKAGEKFDMPVLDYSRDGFTQEGLNRAIAAKQAGIKEMPVLIVRNPKTPLTSLWEQAQETVSQRIARMRKEGTYVDKPMTDTERKAFGDVNKAFGVKQARGVVNTAIKPDNYNKLNEEVKWYIDHLPSDAKIIDVDNTTMYVDIPGKGTLDYRFGTDGTRYALTKVLAERPDEPSRFFGSIETAMKYLNKPSTQAGFSTTGILAGAGALGTAAIAANPLIQAMKGISVDNMRANLLRSFTPVDNSVTMDQINAAITPQQPEQQTVSIAKEMNLPYADAIELAYKKYPDLPRGYLELLFDIESTLGSNKRFVDNPIYKGNYGWLTSITQVARDELTRNKIPYDLSTPEGAFEAAAAYSNLRNRGYSDPVELWYNVYNGRAGGETALNAARKRYKKYQ